MRKRLILQGYDSETTNDRVVVCLGLTHFFFIRFPQFNNPLSGKKKRNFFSKATVLITVKTKMLFPC